MATYTLAPAPYHTVLDTAGAPVSNACVWTYAAGTTTPLATYSDAAGTPNTNPIRTDPAGRFTAYLVPGTAYKFVYETPCSPPSGHGTVLRTADNIAGTPPTPSVTPGTWLPTLGGTATYSTREGTYVRIGPLVFARGVVAVTTLGTGAINQISGLPFPAAGQAAVVFGNFAGLAAPVVSLSAYLPDGATAFTLVGLSAAGPSSEFLVLLASGTTVTFSVTYLTSAP